MDMFARANTAWKIQSAKEQAVRAEEERRLRTEFEEKLEEITGTAAFKIDGTDEGMSTEIEGFKFIPCIIRCVLLGDHLSGIYFVTKQPDGTQWKSNFISTCGDFGRELERLKSSANESTQTDFLY